MRQDQWLITVTVDGTKLGVFDKHTGGKVAATDTKYRPGGLGKEKSLGGPQSVENVTVSREYDLTRGDHTLAKTLNGKVGWARCIISKQPLDANGVPYGDPIVETGTLIDGPAPDADSTASGVAMFELQISCDGSVN